MLQVLRGYQFGIFGIKIGTWILYYIERVDFNNMKIVQNFMELN
jgi:hypothetical protein